MPDTLQNTYNLNGPLTVRGADFDGFVQYSYDTSYKCWKRTGGGYATVENIDTPSVLTMSVGAKDGIAYSFEIVTGPYDKTQPYFNFGIVSNYVDSISAGLNKKGFFFFIRPDTGLVLQKGDSSGTLPYVGTQDPSGPNFQGVTGHRYVMRIKRVSSSGTTHLVCTIADLTDPSTILATITYDDTDSELYNSLLMGCYCQGNVANGTNLVDEVRIYKFISDTTAPTLTSAMVNQSGQTITLTANDDYSLPILPETNITGFTVQAKTGSGSWANVSTNSIYRMTATTFGIVLSRPILATEQCQIVYASGNVTDSNNNPLDNQTISAVNNSSANSSSSVKGEYQLAQDGALGCRAIPLHNAPTNFEFMTWWRCDLPYGLDAGWQAIYAGYQTTLTDDIVIKGIAAWITNPGEPTIKIPLAFDGQNGKTLSAMSFSGCDLQNIKVLPNAYIRFVTWFKTSGNGMPYQVYELLNKGSEYCGVIEANSGNLTSADMYNPFPVYNNESLLSSAGNGPLNLMYRPCGVVGKPHPLITGNVYSILSRGDSISDQQDDFGSASILTNGDPNPTKGWNGRSLSALNLPWMRSALSSATEGHFINISDTSLVLFFTGNGTDGTDASATIKRKFTHDINQFGINSLRIQSTYSPNTAGDVPVFNLRHQGQAIMFNRNIRNIQCTITPMTSDWLDKEDANGGESGSAAQAFADFITSRQKVNVAVRTNSTATPGCIGFLDITRSVETDYINNNNVWITGQNGIHPNPNGHQTMASDIKNDMLNLFMSVPNQIGGSGTPPPPSQTLLDPAELNAITSPSRKSLVLRLLSGIDPNLPPRTDPNRDLLDTQELGYVRSGLRKFLDKIINKKYHL